MPQTCVDGEIIEISDEQAAEIDAGRNPSHERPEPVPAIDFLARFTKEERKAIRQAGVRNDDVADFYDLLRAANTIIPDAPMIRDGMQMLVDAGVLSATRRDELVR